MSNKTPPSIRNIAIQAQDLLLLAICLLLFSNRAMAIDYSSLWQWGMLCMVYMGMRTIPDKHRHFPVFIICFWGMVETVIIVLQNNYWLASNHSHFNVTGTFSNPGPLGGLLAICWMTSLHFLHQYMQKKTPAMTLLYSLFASCLLYGLILSGSRAGWVAALAGCIYGGISMFRNRHSTRINLILKGISLILFSLFIIAVYFMRKDSADGRLLIWTNTAHMIADYPLLGVGTGGWMANYMHYQADYFSQNPNSTYTILADNVSYPYNEYLHITAEHGLIGLLLIVALLYVLLSYKEDTHIDRSLKTLLITFLIFSLFSYPADVFSLNLLFISIIGMMRSHKIKEISIPATKVYLSGSILFLCMTVISIRSYAIYHKAYTMINQLTETEKTSTDSIDSLYSFFRYNPQLMDMYSQTCTDKCSLDKELDILQATAKIAPTCELYYRMGDLWKQMRVPDQAKRCYQTATSMIPHRITPQYKLFKLYIEQGNKDAAVDMGHTILKQEVKKEGTKVLRIRAEVAKYLDEYE